MTMRPHHALPNPSGEPEANELARQLALMLGPAYQPVYDSDSRSNIGIELVVEAMVLQDTVNVVRQSLAEAFPDTAVDLLSDWETRLGLPVDESQSTATRQAALVAKVRALAGAQPAQIEAALTPIVRTPKVHTASITEVRAVPRRVFVIVVSLDADDWSKPATRERVEQILSQMVPAHVAFELTVTVGFRCDDNNSLTDRDVLDE